MKASFVVPTTLAVECDRKDLLTLWEAVVSCPGNWSQSIDDFYEPPGMRIGVEGDRYLVTAVLDAAAKIGVTLG